MAAMMAVTVYTSVTMVLALMSPLITDDFEPAVVMAFLWPVLAVILIWTAVAWVLVYPLTLLCAWLVDDP